MKKVKFRTNVDALKLCVKCDSDELYDHLTTNDDYYFDGGVVTVNTRYGFSDDTPPNEIHARVLMDGLPYPYAELQLSNNKYSPFSFMTLNNRVFYEPFTTAIDNDIDGRVSMLSMIDELLPRLGLTLHQTSSVDVCIDCNISALARIKRAIRDVDNLAMYINGRHVEDDAPSIGYYYAANRYKLIGMPTLYVKNTGGLALKVYDKGRELDDASPDKNDYTRNWSGIVGTPFHRLELTIKSGRINRFCAENGLTQDQFLRGLCYEDFRLALLDSLLGDVIRFNRMEAYNAHRTDNVSLLDVIFNQG